MGCNQEKKKKEKKKIAGFSIANEIQIKLCQHNWFHAIICVCSRGNDCMSQETVTNIVLLLPIGISDTLLIGH
jgi:hypothetical protein